MHARPLFAALCAAVIACGEAEREELTPDPQALLVTPDVVSLAAGSEVQLSVQANDGSSRPIPGAAIAFASSDAKRLAVSEHGLVSALGATGTAAIVVSSGALRSEIPVTIRPGEPAAITKESGDQQAAPATRTLATTLAVSVVDALGNPVPGTRVRFRVAQGSSTEPTEAVANSSGVAEARWTLGARAGEQSLFAEVDGARGVIAARFVARADAGPLSRLEPAYPTAATASVASRIRPRVRATDEFGNPQPGISVLWEVTEGDGDTSVAVSETDADGVAETEWRLGETVAVNRLVARAAGLPEQAARFEVKAKAGSPARLVPHEGAAASSPSLRVVDGFANPVPAVLVRFAVVAGGGTVDDEAAMTGDDGLARVKRWAPETYPAALEARIPGEVPPLRFERAAAGG